MFNAAVGSGRWASFVDRFTGDAIMQFEGVPAGPFVGPAAIAEAYAVSPPDDTIEVIDGPSRAGDELVVAYRWHGSGATGTMRFTLRDDLVCRLVVTFD